MSIDQTQPKSEQLLAISQEILTKLVCPLKDAATNLVFGKGNPNAPILFIGEAPGEKEDLQGIPFVGSAGKQLDKMLQSIGLSLDECYVANILKYRPPNNREPQPDEMLRHTPYLVKQINVIKPKVIVTLGNFSTKFVLAGFDVDKMPTISGVGQLHGKIQKLKIGEDECTIIPLYHPAACLYNPNLRDTMMIDFQIISQFLIKEKQETKAKEEAQETAKLAAESNAAAKESTKNAGFSQDLPTDRQLQQKAAAAKKVHDNAEQSKRPQWKPDQKGLGGFF